MLRHRSARVLVLCAASLLSLAAGAETTFTSSVTSANGELSTALTWESDRASCVGSGHPDWDGPKPAAGSMQMPTITLSGTYTLTIECSTPADSTARLSWTPPTQNTDGTTLTNLAGYRAVYGRAPQELTQTAEIANPDVSTYVLEGLTPGTWYFAVKAYTTQGVESAISNVGQKVAHASSSESDFVTLTVNPVPRSPSALTVE
jgi:hypothetical protein